MREAAPGRAGYHGRCGGVAVQPLAGRLPLDPGIMGRLAERGRRRARPERCIWARHRAISTAKRLPLARGASGNARLDDWHRRARTEPNKRPAFHPAPAHWNGRVRRPDRAGRPRPPGARRHSLIQAFAPLVQLLRTVAQCSGKVDALACARPLRAGGRPAPDPVALRSPAPHWRRAGRRDARRARLRRRRGNSLRAPFGRMLSAGGASPPHAAAAGT